MQRRAMELMMATALGALGVSVVLGTPARPQPAARAPTCGLPSRSLLPARESAVSPWAAMTALGYEPVGPVRAVKVGPGRPAAVPLRLMPDPRACHAPEGRCTAGCFEVVALAADEVGPLTIEVAAAEDPTDILAASLRPGDASAGLCYGFPVGHAGQLAVEVRISSARGEGPVQVMAWRHGDPEAPPSPPPRLTLRLPRLGTPRAEVLARFPECAAQLDEQGVECQFHGSLGELPLSRTCEGGCTWWTYRFRDGALARVELERSVADVDASFFGDFADEARTIAEALDHAFGPSAAPEDLDTWSEVEAPADPSADRIVLQRRTWARPEAVTTWELSGAPGYHPVAILGIRVEAPGAAGP